MRLAIFLLIIPFAISFPAIEQVEISEGELVVTGSGFGSKASAGPFRSSYNNAQAAMSWQDTGTLDSSWSLTGSPMLTVVTDPARVEGRRYMRLEYSSRANWGDVGYSAGLNTMLPQSKDLYISWWDYYQQGFNESFASTGGSTGYKWIYLSPGLHPHSITSVSGDINNLFTTYEGGVGGATAEEQRANLLTPFGGGFYARPLSFTARTPIRRGEWYFVEYAMKINSDQGVHDGFAELRINNQLIFRADDLAILGDETSGDYFSNIRFGGNYGWSDPSKIYYRYYGDFYIDGSFQRAVLCDSAEYEKCRHLEVQLPVSWSDNEIKLKLDRGSFNGSAELYLYVFDRFSERSQGRRLGSCGYKDDDCDGRISNEELKEAIMIWRDGEGMSLFQLIGVISRWKG